MPKPQRRGAKPGRPEKPPDERLAGLIRVRVTAAQRAELQSAADRSGADLSTWLRMRGLEAARREVADVSENG